MNSLAHRLPALGGAQCSEQRNPDRKHIKTDNLILQIQEQIFEVVKVNRHGRVSERSVEQIVGHCHG